MLLADRGTKGNEPDRVVPLEKALQHGYSKRWGWREMQDLVCHEKKLICILK